MKIEDILTIRATEVRKYLEGPNCGMYLTGLRRFPSGCCKVASILLLKWLAEEKGLEGIEGIGNGHRPNLQGKHEDQTHFWIEVSGFIVDITADQFNDFDRSVFISDQLDSLALIL